VSHDPEEEALQTSINSIRRFYLLKRRAARTQGNKGLEGVYRQKQEAEAGTDLASDFPAHDALEAAGYSTEEDLDGADTDELVGAGIPYHDAAAALAALE
jgi:hypothetical protein